jgi:hypothetical protein
MPHPRRRVRGGGELRLSLSGLLTRAIGHMPIRSTWQAAPQHHRRTVLKWPPASSVVTIAKVRIHWRDAGYFQFSQMPAWAF